MPGKDIVRGEMSLMGVMEELNVPMGKRRSRWKDFSEKRAKKAPGSDRAGA